MSIKIYALQNYEVNNYFIKTKGITKDINECIKELENDKGFHERILKDGIYKIFGDIDGTTKSIEQIKELIIDYYIKYYNLEIEQEEIKMTQSNKIYNNDNNKKSYHYYIPKYYGTIKKLKEIHINMKEKCIPEIDTSIYSTHWFRLPNQTNEIKKEAHYLVGNTTIKDCICQYYDNNSVNIDNIEYIEEENKINKKNKTKLIKNIEIQEENNNIKYTSKQIERFVQLLSKERCDNYQSWINVGFCLYNINHKYCYIWDKWSELSYKYKENECEERWETFEIREDGLNIGSLLKWCKEDNINGYKQIMDEIQISNIIQSKFPNEFFDIFVITNSIKLFLCNSRICIK